MLAVTPRVASNGCIMEKALSEIIESDSNNDLLPNNFLFERIAATKDKKAFVTLFEYFAPRLKSFLMKGGLSPQLAEEVIQETMLSVWRKAGSFNPAKASASTWIYTIARNKRIDMLRKLNRRTFDSLESHMEPDYEADLVENIQHEQNAQILKGAFKNLPEDQADLIRKAFYEDKTHQELAEELQLPLGTVKSRIRLGMERLRHSLRNKMTQENIN